MIFSIRSFCTPLNYNEQLCYLNSCLHSVLSSQSSSSDSISNYELILDPARCTDSDRANIVNTIYHLWELKNKWEKKANDVII